MKLARVQKQVDIEREVLKHAPLLGEKNKEKQEELTERIRERENIRKEEKEAIKAQRKGKMVIEEEML